MPYLLFLGIILFTNSINAQYLVFNLDNVTVTAKPQFDLNHAFLWVDFFLNNEIRFPFLFDFMKLSHTNGYDQKLQLLNVTNFEKISDTYDGFKLTLFFNDLSE